MKRSREIREPVMGHAIDAYGTPVPEYGTAFWARLVANRGSTYGVNKLSLQIGDCVYVTGCDCHNGHDYCCGRVRAEKQVTSFWKRYGDAENAVIALYDIEYLPDGPGPVDYTNIDEGGVV